MDNQAQKESRAERFKRVAERRTEAVLRQIRILGNCSNKSTYQYTDQEVSKVFRAVEDQLRITKSRFKVNRKIKFTLK